MTTWDMLVNETVVFWYRHKQTVALMLALLIVGVLLSACSSAPPPRPSLNSGEIIQIVKHDDVEVKEKIYVVKKTERYKSQGKWKTRTVCARYKIVEREISPEWYEFELRSGGKTGWTGRLDEATAEDYEEGDQYP